MQDQLDKHPDVIKMTTSEDPSVDIIAKAYFARDNLMNLQFETFKVNHLKKLGYTDSAIQNTINFKFRKTLYGFVDKFISNPDNTAQYNFLDEFNKFMVSEEILKYIETRKNRFSVLNEIKDHLKFYQNLTKSELIYLGW